MKTASIQNPSRHRYTASQLTTPDGAQPDEGQIFLRPSSLAAAVNSAGGEVGRAADGTATTNLTGLASLGTGATRQARQNLRQPAQNSCLPLFLPWFSAECRKSLGAARPIARVWLLGRIWRRSASWPCGRVQSPPPGDLGLGLAARSRSRGKTSKKRHAETSGYVRHFCKLVAEAPTDHIYWGGAKLILEKLMGTTYGCESLKYFPRPLKKENVVFSARRNLNFPYF